MRCLIAGCLLLAGCYDIESVGTVRSDVRWDGAESFRVHLELEDVDPEFFGCQSSTEDCVGRIRIALLVPRAADEFALGDDVFAPGVSLVRSGATNVALQLRKRESHLDLVAEYNAPVGTFGAELTGVALERAHGFWGESTSMVVDMVDGRTVEARHQRVRSRLRVEEGGARTWAETRVLSKRTRDVRVVTTLKEPVRPMFEVLPDLDEALVGVGLLEGQVIARCLRYHSPR